jgi:hypothetical protein
MLLDGATPQKSDIPTEWLQDGIRTVDMILGWEREEQTKMSSLGHRLRVRITELDTNQLIGSGNKGISWSWVRTIIIDGIRDATTISIIHPTPPWVISLSRRKLSSKPNRALYYLISITLSLSLSFFGHIIIILLYEGPSLSFKYYLLCRLG